MMNRLSTKLERIEAKLKPESGWVVFKVRHGREEKDFQKQYAEYIANGGDPDSLFLSIVMYGVTDGDKK